MCLNFKYTISKSTDYSLLLLAKRSLETVSCIFRTKNYFLKLKKNVSVCHGIISSSSTMLSFCLQGTALRVQMEMLQGNKLVGCISMFITLELPCTGFGFGCK